MNKVTAADWIGREETVRTRLDPSLAAMMAATLDQPAPSDGEVLPQLWHWAAFPALAPMRGLGADGHPKLGDFLPPIDLPRRMRAGGALTFHAPLHVGERLTAHARITDVVEKSGGAGRMVFVTVQHDIAGENGLAISERQDIVYLPMPDSFQPPRPLPVPTDLVIDEVRTMSETLLFRYSACTFNAHRIHYDRAYAAEVEKYPGLIVHGPLQATYLIDAARRQNGSPPRHFKFRSVYPMFHHDTLRVLAQAQADGSLQMCTATGSAHQNMQATASWEETT
ncbi:FAS1-like dehydratase domain-containing protein [Puniceibacterium confluentis]|uniref:FAS1-like dehydratase domain-containing protein n=1 Tax=Puniceibacterium confluentis TaxID=1958944 RepID=UPI00164573BA|nr:MaoC family dehydratase N-terminal domain-containing protein [Puniceibacterium confluentis]